MRKALFAVAVAVALLGGTSAFAASRPEQSAAARPAAPSPSAPQGLTLQRLMRAQLEVTRQLARALRRLEVAPLPEPSFGTRTIIDEPDPTGVTDPPARGEDPDLADSKRKEQERAANAGSPEPNYVPSPK